MNENEKAALAKLYGEYRARLVEYIDAQIDNAWVAEELAQDVFDELVEAVCREDPVIEKGLPTALYEIAHVVCARYQRHMERMEPMLLREDEVYHTAAGQIPDAVAEELMRHLMGDDVDDFLSYLYGDERELARLYFVELKSPREIAKVMNITVSTYYKKKERALKNLRWYGAHRNLF